MLSGTDLPMVSVLLLIAAGGSMAATPEARPAGLSCDSLIGAAQAQVEARFAGKGFELHVSPVSAIPERLCAQVQRIDGVKVAGASENPPQRILAIVTGQSDIGKMLEIPVWLAVKATAQVVVAGEDLLQGASLAEVPIAVERREIQGLVGTPIETLDALQGMRISGRVSKGDVITTRHLEPVPVVQRGQSITLTSRRSNIQVATPAVALEDGNVGDVIRGRRADGDQEFRMRVVALDRAEVIRP